MYKRISMNTNNHCRYIFFVAVLVLALHYGSLRAMSASNLPDSAQTHPPERTNYLLVGGGYALGDATLNRLGFMYSMAYGHVFSSLIDAECSAHITGKDGESILGFTQVFSSTAFDITCFFKPLPTHQLRIGVGVSVRQRQFYYSAPNFSNPSGDTEDRYINDFSIGGNAKVDYMLFSSGSIELGSRLSAQVFVPINGVYRFKNNPTTLQELRFLLPPMIISLSAFLRVNF